MKIAHISSEVTPWSQTGGLAEVTAALPAAQRALGDQAIVFSPLYRGVRERAAERAASFEPIGELSVKLGESSRRVRLARVADPGAEGLVFLDVPELFDRPGIYGESGHDYSDNALRYALLAKAAVKAAPQILGAVDVIHAHDWQTGLAPLFARDLPTPATSIFTIHNLAYQGMFDKQIMDELGLPWSLFTLEQLELYDRVSFLKAGVSFADCTTTVSPSYAREILTPQHGHGLEGFLAHSARRLTGIANGIDTVAWNPRTDPALPAHYHAADLAGKLTCRESLARELDLPVDGDLFCGVVSRFAHQKGLDLIAEVAGDFGELGVSLVVLGTGDPKLEDRFRGLAADPCNRTRAVIDFDPALARRIYAGCDVVLMPSRFEPCGLNQLYAMRYGTVPVVHAVGGLRDTVRDPGDEALARGEGTGFCFEHADPSSLRWALTRAAAMFHERRLGWQALVRAAMAADWSWSASARRYRALYTEPGGPAPLE